MHLIASLRLANVMWTGPTSQAALLASDWTARDEVLKSQRARAEFGLGEWLYRHGRTEAAARHFARAGELAPHDFTIRRGTMPMRGLDPMGPEFRAMLAEWRAAGHAYYLPLPDPRG